MSFIDKIFDRLARNKIALFILSVVLIMLYSLPKKDRKIVFFGAMNGRWYGDNARHLFEYLCTLNNVPFHFYWVTKNSAIYRQLKAEGRPVLYQFSLRYLKKYLERKLLKF